MQHRRIIKQGPVVFATNEDGSMDPSSPSSQGLFLGDTRYLSRFQILINDVSPLLLGSTEETLFQSSFLQTNPQINEVPAHGMGILQRNSIDAGRVEIEIGVANWSLKPVRVELSVELGCDFFDSFEARGVKRLKRGQLYPTEFTDNVVCLRYLGLDDILRTTDIAVEPAPDRFQNECMKFTVELGLNERKFFHLGITMEEKAEDRVRIQPSPNITRNPKPDWFDSAATFEVSSTRIDAVMRRGVEDLEMLMTQYGDTWVPAAGLPRFGVPFGRDSLITGIQTLAWNHELARDALRFLAARQGTENNPWNYEQPGKIMHEMHTGELARLKEVPFGLFYGSVDSTPLFLVLGAEYIRWTSDASLYEELEPHFDAAWKWIDDYGDIDGSGYVQYRAHTPPKLSSAALTVGLFNQGWKDNALAVMYSNGTMVTDHPVALAEVQGYLYRALRLWVDLFRTMPGGDGKYEARAAELEERANRLFKQFNKEFWMPDKQYYAMALDGDHRHVDSITSNPGHCLWARLIDDQCSEAVVKTLTDPAMLTDWGIRTMSSQEKAYNPFSYHDGSIWPFENSLIASGLKKYGFAAETQRVFDALMDASLYFEYRRWPEVYCGVNQGVGGVLARQPDASRPQAWSAGAALLFLQVILGISARPFSKHVDITPVLPPSLNELTVDNIRVAGGRLSLRLVREGDSVLLEIKDNPARLDIVIHSASRQDGATTGTGMPAVSG